MATGAIPKTNGTVDESIPIRSTTDNTAIGSYGCVTEDDGLQSEQRLRWYQQPVKRRYVVAGLAFLGFCVIYMLRVNLSVAIVAMTANKNHTLENGTIVVYPDFTWERQTQGVILGSFFYGYIFTQIPGGYLATKFGGKRVFVIGIAATSVLTLLTPFLTHIGTGFLITTRILEGLFEGITYPSIHAIWARWAPPLERSRLAAVAFSGSYVGTVMALPLSGILAQHFGWEWIFYVFGVLGLLWCISWTWIVKDNPEEDRKITDQELEYLRTSIGVSNDETHMAPPWKSMMTSKPVWAIIIAHFSENWGFYTLLTGMPTFMKDVLGYKLDQAGFLAAFPYLLMAGIVQSAGILADYARTKGRLSTTAVRKLFTCGSYACQFVFMSLTALLLTEGGGGTITFISLSLGCGGFAWAGFSVNHLDVAPQYAAILMGISNTIGTIPGIISPAITGYLVEDKSVASWQHVFVITAFVYALGAVFYGIFASGDRQEWSKIDSDESFEDLTTETETLGTGPDNNGYGTTNR